MKMKLTIFQGIVIALFLYAIKLQITDWEWWVGAIVLNAFVSALRKEAREHLTDILKGKV